MSYTLEHVLNEYNVEDLKFFLANLGRPKFYKKYELIAETKKYINETTITGIYNKLNEEEKNILKEAVHMDHYYVNTQKIYAKYGFSPKKYIYHEWGREKVFSLLHFIIYSNEVILDFRDELKKIVPLPEKTQVKITEEEKIKNEKKIFIRTTAVESNTELSNMLRLIKTGKIKVNDKTKTISTSSLLEILSMFSDKSFLFYNQMKALDRKSVV